MDGLLRCREMAHRELAQKTLMQLCADCEDVAVVEKKPMMEGRMMQVTADGRQSASLHAR